MEKENLNNNQEERGASMLEYALLAALISVVAIAGISALGTQASTAFSTVGSAVTGANTAAN